LMNLLVPGAASGVPERLSLKASGREDWLSLSYRCEEASRIAIPADLDPVGLTLLNETVGTLVVEGSIGGRELALETPAVVEFVRG